MGYDSAGKRAFTDWQSGYIPAMETTIPLLPQSWARMLENVEQALARAETELTLPEVSADEVEAQAKERADRWQTELKRLEGHGQQLQVRARLAEERAQQLADSLGQTEDALRSWLAQAGTVRAKLANQAGPTL
jgi:hypothetical protein